ncbi:cardiomyopathy-associated protein 5 [Electrophorus electricus]|uniref:cardiomyopathy-associated protein 5 n=1 Tax=Electrophorus electricus TaxID=8005 RepID=UPI0015D0CA7A|nr:cardiomyopathy-associated protein 5 [Electrophorus electricus]
MDHRTQDECCRVEPEIQEFQDDGTEPANIDDKEFEELHNSLKEVVQDPSVKPKLQCLLADPCFSMVTIQSEDSGVVWETASSRCSTPWASEASSPSDVHSMEGSGTQGNVVIIMDEDKVKRKKKTGSRGKLGDRLRRPGSRLLSPAIGEERPAMVEVSVPNTKPKNSEDSHSADSKLDKDQELFNLISEGFEILNIFVPSKLPTVDEEDSTELIDNLSYLEDTPKIKSKCKKLESAAAIISPEDVDIDSEETKHGSQNGSSQTTLDGQSKKPETDMDYLEKFTLLDQHVPGDESEKIEPVEFVQPEEPQVAQEEKKVDETLDEDSFVIVNDVEIAGEHLDEVFYGAGFYEEPGRLYRPNEENEHMDKETSKIVKNHDSPLFGSQEVILTPIFLSPGPPKIIDQDLLDEPRAMSFHYSDLYEDAVGDKKKEDDFSDAESVISEKSFKRRYSDSDDADGYLEKFILKDDTPVVDDVTEVDHAECERMIWLQSKFEMTGCLTRVKEENEPQEENVNLNQTKLESKYDIIKGQIQPSGFSKECEDCVDVKTDCIKGERVSEALEGCESSDKASCITGKCSGTVEDTQHRGMKTGYAILNISQDHIPENGADVFEAVNQKTDKVVLMEDGKQSEESRHVHIQVPGGVLEDKMDELKDELKYKVMPVPQTNDKTEITSDETSKLPAHDSIKEINEGTDNTVEIKEIICITKEKVSGKSEQHKRKRHDKAEPILVENVDVKDTSDSITVAGNTIQTVPQEKVSGKEIPVNEIEFTMETVVPEKVDKETRFPAREEKVPEPKCQVEVNVALMESKCEGRESREIPAVTQEEVRISAGLSRIPESERQEQVTAKPIVLDVKDIDTADIKVKETEVKTELETVNEHKALEEVLGRETHTTKEKVRETKADVKEKTQKEDESLKDTVPSMVGKMPAGDRVTAENTEIVYSTSAVESLSNVAPHVVTTKKHIVMEQSGKKEKYTGLKVEIPEAADDQILESRGESKESKSEPVSNYTGPLDIPVMLPNVSEVKGDLLVMLPTVLDDVDREQKHKLADTVVSDTHTADKKELPEAISLIPSAETECSSKVGAAPFVSNKMINKQDDREKGDVEINSTHTKSFSEPLKPVSSVVTTEAGDVSSMAALEVEGKNENKSKKVLLKDIHKEHLWKTLEPSSPSPTKEIQDLSTMRVSPLDLSEYNKGSSEGFVVDGKMKTDTSIFSMLRSFSSHEDLSGFGRDTSELELHKSLSEELGFEMVTEQEGRQSEKALIADEKSYQKLSYVQDQLGKDTVEEGYDLIEDGAQISELEQFREAAEIQPMDAFCLLCHCTILTSDGGHENHEVSTLDKAFVDLKDQLNNWISVLQERSENIEDMVFELETAYNSVEENCKNCEEAMDEQNEETLKLVMDQYNEMSQTMEDEKKTKLEQLYDQIVSFQENIDSAKETMEKTTKAIEETDPLAFMSSYKDIDTRLKTTLESAMSLELGPRGLLVFEDYAKGTTGNGKRNQVIPVPLQPHLQPQEPNSATSTSVTVYWTVNDGDIIDCFQVYCMEEPQRAISEEYRVTVKESYCNLEELEPAKCYKVWVMAVNYTGCSLPSERLPFRTAPSVPVINPEACTVLWDSATLRWTSAQPSGADSFTLEYCRQSALEGEGLRSVSGIKGSEHQVFLQPNENFLFYIKSVNAAGASEQSEAALISTRATRFHLLIETANLVLKVSEDKNSVQYPVETYTEISSLIEYPAVLGELLPQIGNHYWETVVTACKAYRIGVAYQSAPRDNTVGDSSSSWCLHCVPTSISCRFELLHDNVESDIFVMDVPSRIGTLLDFARGRLVFFNAQNGQCLGSFRHSFSQPCHPVFVLESPGNLELRMPMEIPEFAKHW